MNISGLCFVSPAKFLVLDVDIKKYFSSEILCKIQIKEVIYKLNTVKRLL